MDRLRCRCCVSSGCSLRPVACVSLRRSVCPIFRTLILYSGQEDGISDKERWQDENQRVKRCARKRCERRRWTAWRM
ncbi:hypothetical protein [Azospirillum doebereinerae]